MKNILTAKEMKSFDEATIAKHKVPSMVLMERAAISVNDLIDDKYPEVESICVLCGPGNNGGDGVAVARLLYLKGYNASAILIGDKKKFSNQLNEQIEIAKSYNVPLKYGFDSNVYADLFVDAMFGIGLKRGLEGEFAAAAKHINDSGKPIIAVDIPSGLDTDCGRILGEVAVKANMVVTFAYLKKGLILGECKDYVDEIFVADVGIYGDPTNSYLLGEEVLDLIPERQATANKGTCGKILVVAGSESIYGACYLSAKAALVTGSGLVKIYTHTNNISSIQQALPEAMYLGYESFNKKELLEQMNWADVILIGPGLGTSQLSEAIMTTVLEKADKPMIIDADGINLAAKNMELLKAASDRIEIILTPHLKEMERLTGIKVSKINYSMEEVAKEFIKKIKCTLILKNFTTVIAAENKIYYCISGNQALATPGSGDVLSGVVSSLAGQGLSAANSATIGAYIHGVAGTNASRNRNIKSVLASDIIQELTNIKKL